MNTHSAKLAGIRSLLLLSLLAGLALAPAVPAQASGVVTDCTETGLAAALAGGGGITFDCGSQTVIDITSPMVLADSATLDGGDTIILTGRGNTRLFEVPSGVTLRLEHIVLDGGNSGASDGGAIRSDGVLILDSSLIQNSRTDDNHSGGAIFSSGPVTITNSTLKLNGAGSGGALFANYGNAVVIISNSTFNTNYTTNTTTGIGGAIWMGSEASLAMTDSGLAANVARSGAGIYLSPGAGITLSGSALSGNSATESGGGIDNVYGTATLTNVTLSGNSARDGGGIDNEGGTATLTNVTLSGNSAGYEGGGIYEYSPFATQNVLLKNTIIASGLTGANCYVDSGSADPAIISDGYNLSSDASCAPYLSEAGDLANENPNLGPLADNGGPTLTQMLNLPSKAIDAIPNGANGCGTTVTTDQRGAPRPMNGKCDIGAVESPRPEADLSASQQDSQDPASVGRPLSYSVVVTNGGPTPATGVGLADTLPAGASLRTVAASQGSCAGTATVICSLGTLASGAHLTVSVTVTPTAAGMISNMVTVTANEFDPVLANNSASERTVVGRVLYLPLVRRGP